MINACGIRIILSSPKKQQSSNCTTTINKHSVYYKISQGIPEMFWSIGRYGSKWWYLITKTYQVVDVTGINNHQLAHLPIITTWGIIKSQGGDILVIQHQYTYVPNSKNIHSSLQLEDFKYNVDDESIHPSNAYSPTKNMFFHLIWKVSPTMYAVAPFHKNEMRWIGSAY